MSKELILRACVIILCGTGLLMLIPVTIAIVADCVKSVKEVFKK